MIDEASVRQVKEYGDAVVKSCSSFWFAEEPWLDLHMFQSGHRRYDQEHLGVWDDAAPKEVFYGEDNWRYAEHDRSLSVRKPTLDGEPSYEGIPQGLHDPREPYWEEWDVRRYAYWSVFAGSAGHTYGSNAVMQFYREGDPRTAAAYGVREGWQEALHHPGAAQLGHLRRLMESVDFTRGEPCERLLLYGRKERYHRTAVFAGESFVFCYTYCGDAFLLDLTAYRGKRMAAYWTDPRSGSRSFIGIVTGTDRMLFAPPRRRGASNDWVLELREE